MNDISPNAGAEPGSASMVVSYCIDVDLCRGLTDDHLEELTTLLRMHGARSQLERIKREIEEILEEQEGL